MLSIKAVKREEMAIVARMIRSSADWYAEFVDEGDLSEHYVDKSWEENNFKRRNFYLGHNEEGDAVGTLSLQYFNDYAYIGYLYLDTAFVGQGFGRDFMNFAEAEAKRQGKKGLFLIAHPEAVWAVKAYQKFGFKCIAKKREHILSWNEGAMQPYYEEDFHLYLYEFEAEKLPQAA